MSCVKEGRKEAQIYAVVVVVDVVESDEVTRRN